jgi:hypothetical protein
MNYERRRSERIGIEKILYKQHLERLKNVEPVTDCHFYGPKITPIPRYTDENNRARRKIEKENAQLLTRLAKVKSGTATHHHMSIVRQLRWQQYLLHVERINRLKRIVQQNQRLLRNIQNVKPTLQLPPIHSPIIRPKSAQQQRANRQLERIQSRYESNMMHIENYTLRPIINTQRVSFNLPTLS